MMWHLLTQPLPARLTEALLHFLWQGLAVALAYWLLQQAIPLRRPQQRYVFAVMALVCMSLCPVITMCLLETPAATGRTASIDETPAALAASGESAMPADATSWPPSPNVRSSSSAPALASMVRPMQPYLLTIWLLGVFLLGARLALGYLAAAQLWSRRRLIPEALGRPVAVIGRRIGVSTFRRVFVCSRVPEAMAVGFFKPVVLLPAAWLTEMPLDVLEAVIAHELAHIRRRDLWVNLVQRMVETLLFYHPAVWWLSNRVRFEREFCCDEVAVAATGKRAVYATALELIARKQTYTSPALLAASFGGERKMKLLERVRYCLGLEGEGERGRWWPAGVVALSLPVAAWFVSSGWVAPQTSETTAADDERRDGAAREREGDRERPDARREGAERDGERREGDRPVARDGERREGEREDARRESPEARERDGDRPAPPRRPGEGDRRPDAPGAREREGERPPVGRRDDDRERPPVERRFDGRDVPPGPPPSPRDAELIRLIMQLREEVQQLRREVNELRGGRPAPRGEEDFREREGERPDIRREGERPRPDVERRDVDRPRPEGERRDVDRPRPDVERRDGDRPRPDVERRDGDRPRPDVERRDGDRPRPDVERRDGEGPPKAGPRDGEGERKGPREGE